uniref:Uncharacterized protein n=1 Tax=Meloidogyne incognita TaxID=6306 RepID=A0A914LR54_MELIC
MSSVSCNIEGDGGSTGSRSSWVTTKRNVPPMSDRDWLGRTKIEISITEIFVRVSNLHYVLNIDVYKLDLEICFKKAINNNKTNIFALIVSEENIENCQKCAADVCGHPCNVSESACNNCKTIDLPKRCGCCFPAVDEVI